jgi:enoyl-CoA hydratase/carnithine racemase
MSVLYEVHDRIAVVTIDRPEVRNAVDASTARTTMHWWPC